MKINVMTDAAKRLAAKYASSDDPDLRLVAQKCAPALNNNPRQHLTAEELDAILLAVDEFVEYSEASPEDEPPTLVADTKAKLAHARPKIEFLRDKTMAREEGGGE